MMALIASSGKEVHPHVISSIDSQQVDTYAFKNTLKLNRQNLEIIRTGLRATVGDYSGTAHVLNMEDLTVAGKTGTAQTSGGRKSHAWFVGYTTSGKTKIAFCIFLEHGGSSYNACLIARDLLTRMKKANIL
jgi:cell division protein FtsI/penicillin-binding protein 2